MKQILITLIVLLAAEAVNAQTLVRKGSSEYGEVLYNWDGRGSRSKPVD
jgi:hypothetical protein